MLPSLSRRSVPAATANRQRVALGAGRTRVAAAAAVAHNRLPALPGSLALQQRRQRRQTAAAAADGDVATAAVATEQQQQQGLVSVTLRKPVGVVFAQNMEGPVFVEEVAPGGNADKSGQVQRGDVLSQCSAVVLKAGKEGQYEREGYGQRPYDNWETVMFSCEGQPFKTVMAALKSNNERWGIQNVTLILRRPSGDEAALCAPAGGGQP